MPHDRHVWLMRIKAVEREHTAARLAIDRLLHAADKATALVGVDVKDRDLRNASDRLEGTYVIRLFAEFETALRLWWAAAKRTEPPGRARDLLDGVAAARRIPFDLQERAHAVREYRNVLTHERETPTAPLPIAGARQRLCLYFSFLPPKW